MLGAGSGGYFQSMFQGSGRLEFHLKGGELIGTLHPGAEEQARAG